MEVGLADVVVAVLLANVTMLGSPNPLTVKHDCLTLARSGASDVRQSMLAFPLLTELLTPSMFYASLTLFRGRMHDNQLLESYRLITIDNQLLESYRLITIDNQLLESYRLITIDNQLLELSVNYN